MEIQPLTSQELRDLRSEERRQRDQLQIAKYIGAIYSHVYQEAKYGSQRYCTFWIVDPLVARAYLTGVIEYNYPWHHKSIRKTGCRMANELLKRPIPEELLEPIIAGVRQLFPDCFIDVCKHDAVLCGMSQKCLIIKFSA